MPHSRRKGYGGKKYIKAQEKSGRLPQCCHAEAQQTVLAAQPGQEHVNAVTQGYRDDKGQEGQHAFDIGKKRRHTSRDNTGPQIYSQDSCNQAGIDEDADKGKAELRWHGNPQAQALQDQGQGHDNPCPRQDTQIRSFHNNLSTLQKI